jgi:hypothetical protein
LANQHLGSSGSSQSVLPFTATPEITAPPEINGVAVRVVNCRDWASEQWRRHPASGHERRFALQDRSIRLVGTELRSEGLEQRDVDPFEYKLQGHD